MLYEFHHSLDSDSVKIINGTDVNFPAHLHNSFEYVRIKIGKMIIKIENIDYFLDTGDAVLIFPNQVHEYKTEEHASFELCIFSAEFVKAYSTKTKNSIPKSNLFKSEINYVKMLSDGTDNNSFTVKGILYLLCGEFHKTAEYIKKGSEDSTLLEAIFKFVLENYNKDCSLGALSDFTLYHHVYLSRFFKSTTGISYTDYVNKYRINESLYLLRNTKTTILEVALACGFDSLRNFNRVFKKIMQITPSEYRELK